MNGELTLKAHENKNERIERKKEKMKMLLTDWWNG